MKNRIVILGSGTCNLIAEKAAASVLIEWDGLRLVYDMGRDTSIRLAQLGLVQDDIGHVFLSHLHPDHVTDIYPFLHAASWSQVDPRNKDIAFYGQPGTETFLKKMFAVFDWKQELGRGFEVTFQDVTGPAWEIEGHTLEVVDLHHAYGLRFGPYAIAGDSSLNKSLVSLLKDAAIGVFDAGHLSNEEIATLAATTQAQTLVCSHQYRPLDGNELQAKAEVQGYGGKLVVAHDLMEFTL